MIRMSTNTLPRIHLADVCIFQRDMSPDSFAELEVHVKQEGWCKKGGACFSFEKRKSLDLWSGERGSRYGDAAIVPGLKALLYKHSGFVYKRLKAASE